MSCLCGLGTSFATEQLEIWNTCFSLEVFSFSLADKVASRALPWAMNILANHLSSISSYWTNCQFKSWRAGYR